MKIKAILNWAGLFLVLLLAALVVYALDIKVELLHFRYLPFTVLCIIFASAFVAFLFFFSATEEAIKSKSLMPCDKIVICLVFFFTIFFGCYFPPSKSTDSFTIFLISSIVLFLCLVYGFVRLVCSRAKKEPFVVKEPLTFTLLLRHRYDRKQLDSFCYMKVDEVNETDKNKKEEKKGKEDKGLVRAPVEKRIEDAILNSFSTPKSIIGITGPWGVGKTYSLNNALQTIGDQGKRIILVQDVGFWEFQDEKSIFRALIKSIFDKLQIGFSDWQVERYIKKCLNKVFETEKIPFVSPLSEEEEEDSVTKQVNNYLTKNNKRLLVVIDDFDRNENAEILFVYKAVASALHFTNTTYLLCYDEKRVADALESYHIPYDYLNKIISQCISVQMPGFAEMSRNYYHCLQHFLGSSERYQKQKNDYELKAVADDCARYCKTIREFELFINRIWPLSFSNSPLDIFDDFRLALLHLASPEIWYTIKDNPQYFVRDHPQGNDPLRSISKEEITAFFANFNKSFGSDFNQLIYGIFPNVRSSFVEQNVKANETEREKESFLPRANNGFFFSLYFTQCDNEFELALADLRRAFDPQTKRPLVSSLDLFYQKHSSEGVAILTDFISTKKDSFGLFDFALWVLGLSGSCGSRILHDTRKDLFLGAFGKIAKSVERKSILQKLRGNFDLSFDFIKLLEDGINDGNPHLQSIKNSFNQIFEEFSDRVAVSDPEKYLRGSFSATKYLFVFRHAKKKNCFYQRISPSNVCRLIYAFCERKIPNTLFNSYPITSIDLELSISVLIPFGAAIQAAISSLKCPTSLQQTMIDLYKDAVIKQQAVRTIPIPVDIKAL
jgi:hypothetical protein